MFRFTLPWHLNKLHLLVSMWYSRKLQYKQLCGPLWEILTYPVSKVKNELNWKQFWCPTNRSKTLPFGRMTPWYSYFNGHCQFAPGWYACWLECIEYHLNVAQSINFIFERWTFWTGSCCKKTLKCRGQFRLRLIRKCFRGVNCGTD